VPERSIGTVLKTEEPLGSVGSNPTASANNAVMMEALTFIFTFNLTAEAMRSKQPKLYAFVVLIPREDNTQRNIGERKAEDSHVCRARKFLISDTYS